MVKGGYFGLRVAISGFNGWVARAFEKTPFYFGVQGFNTKKKETQIGKGLLLRGLMGVIHSELVGRKFLCGLTRRGDALIWDRPRVAFHRVCFSIRRSTHKMKLKIVKGLLLRGLVAVGD